MSISMTSRLRGVTFAAAACAALAAPTSVRAQDSFKQSLPENTLFYLSAPDLERWWTGFQNSAVYKIWREEEVQEFLADLLAMAQEKYGEAMAQAKAMHDQGMIPFDPAKVEQLRLKSMSVAITDLAMPGQEKPGKLSFALSIDFGDTANIASEMIESLVPMALANAPEGAIVPATEEIEGVTMKKITSPMASMMFPSAGLMYGFVDGKLVIGTDLAVTRSVVAGLKGKVAEKNLSTDAEYALCAKQVQASKGEIEVFMRPKAFLDFGVEALRFGAMQDRDLRENVDIDGIVRAIDVLGLNGLKSMGISSGYDGNKGVTKSFVNVPEDERKGLFALSDGSAVDMSHLDWIPKGVGSFSVMRLPNVERIYTVIMDAVAAYDQGVAEMAKGEIAQVEEGLGFNIQKDVFGAFSDELLTYSMPMTGLMATPEFVFMLGCKNPTKTLEVFKKLSALSEGTVALSEVAGEEMLYSIDITLDEFGGGMDPTGMLDPTIGFKNGYMILSFSRSDVKNAFTRFDGQGAESVRENAAFKPYADSIPQNADSLSFSDVATSIQGVYGSLSGMIGMVPIPPEVPIDVGLLPSSEALTKHLFGSIAWARTTGLGWESESVGPFGPEMFVGIAAVGVGAGVTAAVMSQRGMRVRRR